MTNNSQQSGWWFVCWKCVPEALGEHYTKKEEVSVQSRMTPWFLPERCDKCHKYRWHIYEFYDTRGLNEAAREVEPLAL